MSQNRSRFLLCGVLFLGSVPVCFAQLVEVSPGTLSRYHQSIEGPLECLKCHEKGGVSMPEKCLSCHPEISWLKASSRGFHGQQETSDCAACHAEHEGFNETLIQFADGGSQNFNHRHAGWPLADKHATVPCKQCHQVKFQVSEAAELSPRQERDVSFIGLEPVCSTCHEDVHRSVLGENCLECHSPAGWRQPPDDFDHSKTGYVLTGRHTRVACRKCHPESANGAQEGSQEVARLVLKRSHDECSDCHRDVHQGRAGATCSRCHTTNSFFQAAQVAFEHDRTGFPLAGKHADLRCEKCHGKSPEGVMLAANLKLASKAGCGGCHSDAHGGQLTNLADHGTCATCHRVEGWKPVNFSLEAHAVAGFPLQGRHAEVECQICHGPNRKGPQLATPIEQLGSAGFAFDLMKPTCWQCHLDPHGGEFSPGGKREKQGGCLACHDLERFRPSTIAADNHKDFGFPITGAHRTARCDQCHSEVRPEFEESGAHPAPERVAEKSLLLVADGRCASCHDSKSPHGVQFEQRTDGGACDSCHGDEKFKPADRFSHEQGTLFPLLGSHQNVDCAECHFVKKKKKTTTEIVLYKGTPIGCRECHRKGVPARPISW